MNENELVIAVLEKAVETVGETGRKKLFGAFGVTRENKVFAMVTKYGEMVLKCDVDEFHSQMADLGAEPWSPHKSRGAMGTWLVLPESVWTVENDIIDFLSQAYSGLKL